RVGVGREKSGVEESLDLFAGHLPRLVAREPCELRVAIPAQHRAEVLGPMTPQRDQPALDDRWLPLVTIRAGCPRHAPDATAAPRSLPSAAMRRWSEVAEQISATTRTSQKIALLAGYLGTLGPDELPLAAIFMAGRAFPERDARTTGLGWSAIARVAEEIAG